MKKKVAIVLTCLLLCMSLTFAACDNLMQFALNTISEHLDIIISVELSEEEITLDVNESKTITAEIVGLGDWAIEDLEYKSTPKNVVKVELNAKDQDVSYIITGLSAGETTVSFYMVDYDSGEEYEMASLKVTVNAVATISYDLSDVPEFDGETAYVILNDNIPLFEEEELLTEAYEYYSPLDALGRCGVTIACVCTETMPTEPRGEIGSVKPSGWHTVKYDIVSGKYLYNRCHLIGYQLTAENANVSNLITGTRFLNIEGNLVFENMVADYVKETGNHVMYRVTPIFEGDNLVASGVVMEGYSVEDNGEGICYNVYCYNAQPGIYIDYATGESHLLEE